MTNAIILFCVAIPALIVFFLRINIVAAWVAYVVLSLLFESTTGYLWLDKLGLSPTQQTLALLPLAGLAIALVTGIGRASKAMIFLHSFVAATLGVLVVVLQLPKFSSVALDTTAPAYELASKQYVSLIVFGLIAVLFFVVTSTPKQHKKSKHEK
jgi:hypothetical protein